MRSILYGRGSLDKGLALYFRYKVSNFEELSIDVNFRRNPPLDQVKVIQGAVTAKLPKVKPSLERLHQREWLL